MDWSRLGRFLRILSGYVSEKLMQKSFTVTKQTLPSDAYTNQRGLRGFNSKMNLEVLIGLTILDLPDDRRCLDEIVAP